MFLIGKAIDSVSSIFSSGKSEQLQREKARAEARLESEREARKQNDAETERNAAQLNQYIRDEKAEKKELIRHYSNQISLIELSGKEKEEQLRNQFEREMNLASNAGLAQKRALEAKYKGKIETIQTATQAEIKAYQKRMEEMNDEVKESHSQLNKEKNKRLDDAKEHGEKMEEVLHNNAEKVDGLHRERAQEVDGLHRGYREKEDGLHDKIEKNLQDHHHEQLKVKDAAAEQIRAAERETNGYKFLLATAVTASHYNSLHGSENKANEVQTTAINAMRECQTRRKDLQNELHKEIGIEKRKKERMLHNFRRGKAVNTEHIFDKLAKESSTMNDLINLARKLIINPCFDAARRNKGMALLSIIQEKNTDSDSELGKCREVKDPEWSDLVKLGVTKNMAPVNPDWYDIRAASLPRRLYIRSTVGASQHIYGSKLRRGVQPNSYAKASGSVMRKALKSIEALKGRKDLDRIAADL